MLSLKIPPPVLAAIALLMIYGCVLFMPVWQFKPLWSVAVLLMIIAIIIGLLSMSVFARVNTTISPFTPQATTQLVTTGIYQYSRNPMYLSLLLLLIAAVFIGGELSAAMVVIVFIATVNQLQIKPEEKVLLNLFGNDYRRYCQHVRRWL
ncbi:methyltransferase family protein [Photobacterium aquimaris]|uniref:Isoprenylcysteine carboxylmethyltransferase family protein n=1 Tax=Photobacterium aquimaris TaxID=512643 RepID=A0A2T3HSK3_9GAMM|nr:isoprenylcysteine carboxylmethyltransferase family protein [Photobacterium aquimaris]PST97454.1 isoprenylcysteine carboxylmethyltransferase family protein [Photobacterium aquimaris]